MRKVLCATVSTQAPAPVSNKTSVAAATTSAVSSSLKQGYGKIFLGDSTMGD